MSDPVLAGALRPDWPAQVLSLMSTRAGGVSAAPYDSLNLRPSSLAAAGDEPAAVAENQRRFAAALGATPVWLNQVHGNTVARLHAGHIPAQQQRQALPIADASVCDEPGVACAVLVADCLPVLLATRDGRAVGAAHAGWRGLASGVVEAALEALCALGQCKAGEVLAWLGPCIGPRTFEVGEDVVEAFGGAGARFTLRQRDDGRRRWLADLAGLASDRLHAAGVEAVYGGGWCTVESASRFFSFRRDGDTGRMAAAIAVGVRRGTPAPGAAPHRRRHDVEHDR